MFRLRQPEARMRPPRLAENVIPRARLFESIDQSMATPLLLLTAPAGFGWRTLLASWAALSPRCVAWLPVTQADNGRAEFCHALLTALRVVMPGFNSSIEPLLELETTPGAAYLAQCLADDLAQL